MSSKKPPLNAEAAEFNPNTFVKGTTSTPYDNHGLDLPKRNCHGTLESQAPKAIRAHLSGCDGIAT